MRQKHSLNKTQHILQYKLFNVTVWLTLFFW